MNLPKLSPQDVAAKKVLLRLDLDVSADISRVENAKETLEFLVENSAQTIIIGHKGRPNGGKDGLTLKDLTPVLSDLIGKKVVFQQEGQVVLKENLRFDPGEEANNEDFAKKLASLADVYVNEAFAASHRSHASIVGVPKFLPHFAGFRFLAEVANLSRVRENPKRPLVVLISGIKEDKVEMARELTKIVDKVLVGGKLPSYFGEGNPNPEKILIADLTFDGFDISLNSITRFKQEIAKAGTLVLAGVLGKYEEEGHRLGTKEIFQAVSATSAFKVAGGGDTEAALTIFGLTSKFDWISVGGGAMLEFLLKGTLPGINALLE
ncbi:MAG: phosphoglycerate kinase [Patescibacteria group bacterium]